MKRSANPKPALHNRLVHAIGWACQCARRSDVQGARPSDPNMRNPASSRTPCGRMAAATMSGGATLRAEATVAPVENPIPNSPHAARIPPDVNPSSKTNPTTALCATSRQNGGGAGIASWVRPKGRSNPSTHIVANTTPARRQTHAPGAPWRTQQRAAQRWFIHVCARPGRAPQQARPIMQHHPRRGPHPPTEQLRQSPGRSRTCHSFHRWGLDRGPDRPPRGRLASPLDQQSWLPWR